MAMLMPSIDNQWQRWFSVPIRQKIYCNQVLLQLLLFHERHYVNFEETDDSTEVVMQWFSWICVCIHSFHYISIYVCLGLSVSVSFGCSINNQMSNHYVSRYVVSSCPIFIFLMVFLIILISYTQFITSSLGIFV